MHIQCLQNLSTTEVKKKKCIKQKKKAERRSVIYFLKYLYS